MKRELALEIIEDVLAQDYCEVLVSGEKTAYIKPKTKEYHDRNDKGGKLPYYTGVGFFGDSGRHFKGCSL